VRTRLACWAAGDALFQRTAQALSGRPESVWLVGGTVRDVMLGRAVCDIDLAVGGGDAVSLGRRLADDLSAHFFVLDHQRRIARVLLGDTGEHIDLANLRADTITGDLCARDFTINAMAAPLQRPDALIDPCDGLADLTSRLLRAASTRSLADDPLRILRMARLAAQLGFEATPETLALAAAALDGLAHVAHERIRDELFLMLVLPQAHLATARLHSWGIADALVARGTVWSDAHLAAFETWQARHPQWPMLAAWQDEIEQGWNAPVAGGRTRGQLVKLALWLMGLSASAAEHLLSSLALSTSEVRHVRGILGAHGQLAAGTTPAKVLSRYRYYRAWRAAGADAALLALTAQEDPAARQALTQLLDSWYADGGRAVNPPPILTGRDLLALGVPAGPQVGELLEALRQAQVAGEVNARAEAEAFVLRARKESSG